VLREIERGGQVFIVHNQVYDIETFAAGIREIVPEARVGVAHGQMRERALERVMLDFVEGRYDTLVCTTIIESGLDIPNANTMLVHRADRLGLAQLYQLRGRVGRSERQAYTYLIVPDEGGLAGEARKRLEVLYEFTELGSGFRIARHDLEIRGAGNLLGADQSGHIRAVGYDLYMEMLEKAIRELRGEDALEEVDPGLMDRPPRDPNDVLAKPSEMVRWATYGGVLFLITLAPLLFGPDVPSPLEPSVSMTMAFVVMSLGTLFSGLAIRRDPGSGLSAPIVKALGILGVSAVLTVIATEWGLLQRFLMTESLTGTQWLVSIGLAAITLVVIETDKAIRRRS